jgi:hypothetical protein
MKPEKAARTRILREGGRLAWRKGQMVLECPGGARQEKGKIRMDVVP